MSTEQFVKWKIKETLELIPSDCSVLYQLKRFSAQKKSFTEAAATKGQPLRLCDARMSVSDKCIRAAGK